MRRGWHSRGYLPHFEGGEIAQFITFRLADSLPAERLEQWRKELEHLPAEQAELETYRRIEAWLDKGTGGAWLRKPRFASLVENALLHFDGARYRLHAWIVMPNHVHVLVSPMEAWSLPSIVGSWKSFTSKEAGKLLRRKGKFWQEEYFDRYIRSERHFWHAVGYIESNPVKAGLCATKEEWKYGSASYGARASRPQECARDGRAP